MALGIGANTAIFSVVHGGAAPAAAVHGRRRPRDPPPAAAARRHPGAGVLRRSRWTTTASSRRRSSRSSSTTTCGSCCSAGASPSAWRPASSRGTTSISSASGRSPGRTFRAGDDKHGADAVLVLSNAYWKSRFGGDPARRRPGLRDERSAAHGDRRAAADSAVPRRERRLHAGVGVSVPIVGGASARTATREWCRRSAGCGPVRRSTPRCRSRDGRVESPAGVPGELPGERRLHRDRACRCATS